MAIINDKLHISDVIFKKRIDSEYFQPNFVINEKNIRKTPLGVEKLSKIAYITDGDHSVRKYKSYGIPFLTTENFSEFNINYETERYITALYEKTLARSRSEKNAIYITKTGKYYGKAAICLEDLPKFNIPADVGKIRVTSNVVSPFFVVAFLNSKYGNISIRRENSGGTRDRITLVNLRKVEVPLFADSKIEAIIRAFIEKSTNAKALYMQAQELLEKELGLDQLVLKKVKSYETSISQVLANGRADAEFYNPHAKEIYKLKCFLKSKPLKKIFDILRGKTPSSYLTSGIPILKTKNIRTPIIDESKINDYVICSDKYTKIRANDLIIATMGVGSLGRISYVFDDSTDAIIDGTLRILRAKEGFDLHIIPTLLFLTSAYGQILIYQGIIGTTGIISLPNYHLKNIKIPILDINIVKKINSLVIDSNRIKKESELLLEQAKKRVEDLIEGTIKQ